MKVDVLADVLFRSATARAWAQGAAQQSPRQGAPGNDPNAIGLAGRNDFEFDGALEQIVQTLL